MNVCTTTLQVKVYKIVGPPEACNELVSHLNLFFPPLEVATILDLIFLYNIIICLPRYSLG